MAWPFPALDWLEVGTAPAEPGLAGSTAPPLAPAAAAVGLRRGALCRWLRRLLKGRDRR